MTEQHIAEKPIQSREQRREIASRNLAKYFCVIAGIEPVDSLDGSSNWWMFLKEAEETYDGLLKRFPPAPSDTNGVRQSDG